MTFKAFITERQHLSNVSPRTIQWYNESFKWLGCDSGLTEVGLKSAVIRMREKGLKPSSCNNRIRAWNAYLKWAHVPFRVPLLKEPKVVLPTFTAEDVRKLMAYKPRTDTQRRLHTLILFLMDTGARISEALTIYWANVDFDNLLVLLRGKGMKERIVPFSHELRKILWFYPSKTPVKRLVFCTRDGRTLGRRDVLRDTKLLCKRLGITPPVRTLHALRHTFALTYVRGGGSIFHLQRCLGHTSLDMVRRYVNLNTDDLIAAHRSPLSTR